MTQRRDPAALSTAGRGASSPPTRRPLAANARRAVLVRIEAQRIAEAGPDA